MVQYNSVSGVKYAVNIELHALFVQTLLIHLYECGT